MIQDAVLRDKALDAFEAAKEREVQELHAAQRSAHRGASSTEIEAFLQEEQRRRSRA